MSNVVCCIPADLNGNKLWIKDFRIDKNNKMFLKYKSTYNNMPFAEVEIFVVDSGENLAITGGDGTVLFRFSVNWISKFI